MKAGSTASFALLLYILCRSCEQFCDQYGVTGVVGGALADIDDFRYKVSIQSIGNVNHVCGGAILHPEWVVTSALCISTAMPKDLVVAVGAQDFLEPEALHHGLSSHFPDIANVHRYDIALVKLIEPIELGEETSAAILPTADTEHNTVATVAGWGTTEVGGASNTQLHRVKQLVVGNFMCSLALGIEVAGRQLCAANLRGVGLCHGDEGAPLMTADGVVVGVASWRLGCGDGAPTLYSSVHAYRGWILDTMRDN